MAGRPPQPKGCQRPPGVPPSFPPFLPCSSRERGGVSRTTMGMDSLAQAKAEHYRKNVERVEREEAERKQQEELRTISQCAGDAAGKREQERIATELRRADEAAKAQSAEEEKARSAAEVEKRPATQGTEINDVFRKSKLGLLLKDT